MTNDPIVAAWMLSASPPLFFTGTAYDNYLGLAPAFGARFGNIDAGFIVFPTGSLERPGIPVAIRTQFLRHGSEYPRHWIQFLCNTAEETRLLQMQGLPATFLNQNFTVSEKVFYPFSSAEVEFDAVYNARFSPEKRLELCALVPSVGHITFLQDRSAFRVNQFTELYRRIILDKPEHLVLNPMQDGLPVRMSHAEINAQLARAAVGLILSEQEGGNYASMEYMLAGLPVVSTHSIGGRDVYFDRDYCIICEPTREAVRDAVAQLKARNISREEVRARTLAKIEPERARFLALADEVLAELEAPPRFAGLDWPFREWSSVAWHPGSYYLDQFEAAASTPAEGAARL